MKRLNLKLKKLNPAGDTIIEVMIVLAILGLSFSISYATANQGVRKSRNAQEHSIALGILNGQVELTRSAFAQKINLGAAAGVAGGFCLPDSDNPAIIVESYLDDEKSQPNPACTQRSIYHIDNSFVDGYFKFHVTWPGLGDLGQQQETISYKIAVLANNTNPWDENVPAPEPIPEPEPIPTNTAYHWGIDGGLFKTTNETYGCTPEEQLFLDHLDGCFTNDNHPSPSSHTPTPGVAMHAFRDIEVTYNYASGTENTSPFYPGGNPYNFVIAYDNFQWFGPPPPNYKFKVKVTIKDADGDTLQTFDAQLSRTNDGTNQVVNGRPHYIKSINLSAKPASIILHWSNNGEADYGGHDANLQIVNLQIGREGVPPPPID